MKKQFFSIMRAVLIAALSMSPLCFGDTKVASNFTTPAKKILLLSNPHYTFIKDCKDTGAHENAAFTRLHCTSIGGYQVIITKQSPLYFNIFLIKDKIKVGTDFTIVSHERPIEVGKAIEWHFMNNKPKYMIVRLSWGPKSNPFEMRQYLIVNLISNNKICALATISVSNNKNANQKARNLIIGRFQKIVNCPTKMVAL